MPTPGTIGGGRYICTTPLGGGYFGEVWLAHDDYLDADVAVKLLDPNVNLDDVLLESQLLERLRRHDRVANVRDVYLGPPAPFIVMDYMPGGSVGARLAAGYV